MYFDDFSAFRTHLDGLGLFSMQLGLQRMDAALSRLRLTRPSAVVVHVVGTNGKGSTSGFLAALARAHGLRVGLYTSPHLVDVRERIRVDGHILPEADWITAANAVLDRCRDVGLTYFELLTMMALWLFREHTVDLIVLEAGLGGTHDATRAVAADLTVMTPVGMDHENVLGPTLGDIVRDKAGALGRCPAVTGLQEPEVLRIFEVASRGFPLQRLDLRRGGDGFGFAEAGFFVLPGLLTHHPPYQTANAALAVLAWLELGQIRDWSFNAALCTEALDRIRFSGRFCRHGRFLVDGAHNPMGLAALCTALERAGLHFNTLVFQAMRDKTLDQAVLHRLHALADTVLIPAMPELERAGEPTTLAARFGAKARAVADLPAALQQPGSMLVCGSLYLAGAFYTLHPQFLEA